MSALSGIPDERLVVAAQGGDCDAFGELVQRYQGRLFGSLVRMVGCENLAADLVQDAFVLAWRKLDRFAGRSSFYTWLFRIARNTTISCLRSRRVAISLDSLAASGEYPEQADRSAGPGDRMEQEESRMLLQQALNQLSEEHRTILLLREMDGMDYEQIGEALELPVGTVRSRLFRARMQLREALQGKIPADA